MPHRCNAPGCNTKYVPGKNQLFQMPTSKSRVAKWIKAMGFDESYASGDKRLCELHFLPEDFQYMGDGRRRLFRTAVPSQFHHLDVRRKGTLNDHCYTCKPGEGKGVRDQNEVILHHVPETTVGITLVEDQTVVIKSTRSQDHQQYLELIDLREQHKQEVFACHELLEKAKWCKGKIAQLRGKLQKLDNANTRYELLLEKIRSVFRKDQIRFLEAGTIKGQNHGWTNHTIEEGLNIRRVCGNEGYQLLRRYGWPLPSTNVLERRLRKLREAKKLEEQWNDQVPDTSHGSEEETGDAVTANVKIEEIHETLESKPCFKYEVKSDMTGSEEENRNAITANVKIEEIPEVPESDPVIKYEVEDDESS